MTPNLQGCLSKLDRAEIHINALEAHIRSFDAKTEPSFRVERKFDPDTNVFRAFFPDEPRLPDSFGLLIGDAIHNLRSSLDHLAWQLALLTTRKPSRRTEFPVVIQGNDWLSEWLRDKLIHIKPADRARLESYQPFMERGGVKAKDNILAVLHRLDIRDKHQVIEAIAAKGTGARAEVDGEPEDCEITKVTVLPDDSPLHKDTDLMRVLIRPTGSNPRVRMNTELRVYPTFGDGQVAEYVLRRMHAYVHDLLLDFEASF